MGVSLIEMMLIMAIAGLIAVMGIRQYRLYRIDADIRQLKYNVDTLFQAMSLYYRANCYGTTHPKAGVVTAGTLNPDVNPDNPFPISIENDLKAKGFLMVDYPRSPLVDEGSNGGGGYILQFNESIQPKMVCKQGIKAKNADLPDCTEAVQVGTIVAWKAQIAVLLNDTDRASAYLKLLDATCLSSYDSNTNTVSPCSDNISGNYIVWERWPSFGNSFIERDNLLNPTLDQFNQMYTTYPITHLTGSIPSGTTPGVTGPVPQYFLCGS